MLGHLGIPEIKAPDYWVSFWAGLFSSTLSSLFIGLIVGLILWKFQQREENMQVKHECEREMSIFIQKLRTKLRLSNVTMLSDQADTWLPKFALDSLDIISNQPIEYWTNYLFDQSSQEKLAVLRYIGYAQSEFLVASSELDTIVADRVRIIYRGNNSVYYRNYIPTFLALINGAPKQEIAKWSDVYNDDLQASYNKLTEDDHVVSSSIGRYRESKEQLLLHFNLLQQLVSK